MDEKSLSIDCRLVFDGSQGTKGGCSLNSLLAKGANGINNLIGILIRWITCKHAFHTVISKMYDAIRLDKTHWRYQLYLWNDDLTEGVKPLWNDDLTEGVKPLWNDDLTEGVKPLWNDDLTEGVKPLWKVIEQSARRGERRKIVEMNF